MWVAEQRTHLNDLLHLLVSLCILPVSSLNCQFGAECAAEAMYKTLFQDSVTSTLAFLLLNFYP